MKESMYDSDSPESVVIDLSNVNTARQLQQVLRESLGFPSFYGLNWDAFWDAITGLVELPQKLIFLGWEGFNNRLPEEADQLTRSLTNFNKTYPSLGCTYEQK